MAPKIAGVVETSLYVEDLARSARFYAEVLGFERLDEDERITAMAVGSHQVLLLCKKGASKDWKVPHDGNGQLHLAFAIDRGQLEGWSLGSPNMAYRLSIERLGHAVERASISEIRTATRSNSKRRECGASTESAATIHWRNR